ncbi:hypothetical protein [Fulvivirga sedimenti]|uniref:Uncharacterized protein n=1 Tax=Fulvivirga sedimenti TaxID=2879465 RepID=A0A9X1HTN1_9BACT|nr:hypothetical protein [Fulvivirga sedimenti]MCA6075037.1 hypothetical protein [Fulvivirga sedimenti]MCA6076214.1 hypothetical protein [Fulvivirga sedimenti]MCA6077342.1 hypothetical protein [Fulvivirga sedimenti]
MKYFLTCILILLMQEVNSQIKAVTEKGDTIYVYDNGTWSFELLDELPDDSDELNFLSDVLVPDTIAQHFLVPGNATKEVSDARGMFTIRYDENKWRRVPPATLNEEADFAFQAKETDIWSIVIAEEITISPDKLFLIAKNTMKERIGYEPKVIKTEVRTVNGSEVVRGVLLAEFSGITFIFDTYYFSNDLGSVQFTTYTSDKIWERNEDLILELLNGFIGN